MTDEEWWDHKFNRLVRQCFEEVPYDPAEHEECDKVEEYSFFQVEPIYSGCITCKPKLRVRSNREVQDENG